MLLPHLRFITEPIVMNTILFHYPLSTRQTVIYARLVFSFLAITRATVPRDSTSTKTINYPHGYATKFARDFPPRYPGNKFLMGTRLLRPRANLQGALENPPSAQDLPVKPSLGRETTISSVGEVKSKNRLAAERIRLGGGGGYTALFARAGAADTSRSAVEFAMNATGEYEFRASS